MLHVLKIAVVLFPLFLGAQLVIKPENLTKKENTYWDFNKTQIQSTGSYYQDILGATQDKHGKWNNYDKFGKIEEERNCYRGKLNGKVVLYYPNGKLKQEGYFKIIFQQYLYGSFKQVFVLKNASGKHNFVDSFFEAD